MVKAQGHVRVAVGVALIMKRVPQSIRAFGGIWPGEKGILKPFGAVFG
jgi:hypothetical protein